MELDMCEDRKTIIANDPDLQDYQTQIEILEGRLKDGGGNGETRMRLIQAKVELESIIETRQNKQNISHMLNMFMKLDRERILYPSILRQLFKIPKLGWTLLMAAVLSIWVIASIPGEALIAGLTVGGIHLSPAYIRVTVIAAVIILLYYAFITYTRYVEDQLKERERKYQSE